MSVVFHKVTSRFRAGLNGDVRSVMVTGHRQGFTVLAALRTTPDGDTTPAQVGAQAAERPVQHSSIQPPTPSRQLSG